MPAQASSLPEMSPATRDILAKVRRMVPPMLDKFHKGQHGRVAVIGGSEDYTGAPYFSAMASARLGCDMSHIICTPTAAAVIKTYSPNLMVHPLMRQTPTPDGGGARGDGDNTDAGRIAEPIIAMLPRLHVLVVGPGLGRDRLMHDTAAAVLRAARDSGVPAVLDADALQIVQRDPGLVKGWRGVVLTPNVVEFGRLCGALGLDAEGVAAFAGGVAKDGQQSKGKGDVDGGRDGGGDDSVRNTAKVEALARALGGVTVIQKGKEDYISNGETTLTVDLAGGRKRSGGQGDTLTGAIATFLGWRKAYLDRLWEPPGGEGERLSEHELVGLAAFGASAITKECSRLAFAKRGRSLQASDLTDEVHTAFLNLFGEDDDDESGERSGSSKL